MVDVALSLSDGDDGRRIRAVSRHGLVPRRHRRDLTNVRRFHIPTEYGQVEPMVSAIFTRLSRIPAGRRLEGRDRLNAASHAGSSGSP